MSTVTITTQHFRQVIDKKGNVTSVQRLFLEPATSGPYGEPANLPAYATPKTPEGYSWRTYQPEADTVGSLVLIHPRQQLYLQVWADLPAVNAGDYSSTQIIP